VIDPIAIAVNLREVGPASMIERWTDMDPWSDAYLSRELAAMAHITPFDQSGIRLKLAQVTGVLRCYMRQDFLDWGPFPHLAQDGKVWMSVTPMEIESQYMPIKLASGRVGVGGLGLGYVALRMASKDDVDEVVVYEINPVVIALFERNFPSHPKIRIVQQDVTTMRGEEFDLFFNDVYPTMLTTDTISHMRLLEQHNTFGWYHPWGIESMIMALVRANAANRVPFMWRYHYFPFLKGLITATSVSSSEPITVAGSLVPSDSETTILSACPTT